MTYMMTYVRRRGAKPRTMNLDMSERAATQVCKSFANSAHRVVLAATDDDGLPVLMGRWNNGRASRDLPTVRAPRPLVIEGEIAEPEDESEVSVSLDEQTDDGADETLYDGFCVKCHEHRTFPGEIHETANGRRMAQGPCPVCGTRMNRILKNVAVEQQESYDTPDDEPENEIEDSADDEPVGVLHILQKDDAGRGRVRLFCSCDEWETTVKRGSANEVAATAAFSEHAADDEEYDDHPDTDETAPEILPTDDPEYDEAAQQEAEAAAIEVGEGQQEIEAEETGNGVSSPEFSDAPPAKKATAKKAQPAKASPAKAQPEKAQPRKRAARKQAQSDADAQAADAELQEVRNRRVSECPHCHNNVVVKEVPSAKIAYLMIHPGNGKPECLGSRSSVEWVDRG